MSFGDLSSVNMERHRLPVGLHNKGQVIHLENAAVLKQEYKKRIQVNLDYGILNFVFKRADVIVVA